MSRVNAHNKFLTKFPELGVQHPSAKQCYVVFLRILKGFNNYFFKRHPQWTNHSQRESRLFVHIPHDHVQKQVINHSLPFAYNQKSLPRTRVHMLNAKLAHEPVNLSTFDYLMCGLVNDIKAAKGLQELIFYHTFSARSHSHPNQWSMQNMLQL